MKARSINEAWKIADELFPTDYMKDEKASANAGYPVYWSTAAGVNAWISDLGDRLELNQNGKSVNIWIEPEQEPEREPEVRTEKTVHVDFETIETKRGETVRTEMKASVNFGIETNFSDIATFSDDVTRILKRAKKAVKNGQYIRLTVSEGKYRWTGDKLVTIDFNAWEAAPTGEQDIDGDYIYFRPNTRYTNETRDMMLYGKNVLKELSEYIG